jgi:hypothetical protein
MVPAPPGSPERLDVGGHKVKWMSVAHCYRWQPIQIQVTVFHGELLQRQALWVRDALMGRCVWTLSASDFGRLLESHALSSSWQMTS